MSVATTVLTALPQRARAPVLPSFAAENGFSFAASLRGSPFSRYSLPSAPFVADAVLGCTSFLAGVPCWPSANQTRRAEGSRSASSAAAERSPFPFVCNVGPCPAHQPDSCSVLSVLVKDSLGVPRSGGQGQGQAHGDDQLLTGTLMSASIATGAGSGTPRRIGVEVLSTRPSTSVRARAAVALFADLETPALNASFSTVAGLQAALVRLSVRR